MFADTSSRDLSGPGSQTRSGDRNLGPGALVVRRQSLHIRLRNPDCQLPHPQDVGCPLRYADAAAGVEDVEQVGALQALLERRQHEARAEEHAAERVVALEQVAMMRSKRLPRHVDLGERVLRVLDLL